MSEVRENVMSWKRRQNQRYKVLRLQVSNRCKWIMPDTIRRKLPDIKDPTTVLYDMAMRNPTDTPRGRGYCDRNRVYPCGVVAEPIFECHKHLGIEYDQSISR